MAWPLAQWCNFRHLCCSPSGNSRCQTNPRPGSRWSKTRFRSSLWCPCAVRSWSKSRDYFSSTLNTYILYPPGSACSASLRDWDHYSRNDLEHWQGTQSTTEDSKSIYRQILDSSDRLQWCILRWINSMPSQAHHPRTATGKLWQNCRRCKGNRSEDSQGCSHRQRHRPHSGRAALQGIMHKISFCLMHKDFGHYALSYSPCLVIVAS